jgi:hypothetical protein
LCEDSRSRTSLVARSSAVGSAPTGNLSIRLRSAELSQFVHLDRCAWHHQDPYDRLAEEYVCGQGRHRAGSRMRHQQARTGPPNGDLVYTPMKHSTCSFSE